MSHRISKDNSLPNKFNKDQFRLNKKISRLEDYFKDQARLIMCPRLTMADNHLPII